MESAHRGQQALDAKRYDEAIELYTKALETSKESPVYHIRRSTALQRTKNYPEALLDAEKAVAFASARGRRELVSQAQLRRAIALFYLQQYGNSNACLKWARKLDDKEKSIPIWESQVAAKLKNLGEDDEAGKVTVIEIPKLPPSTSESETKAKVDASEKSTGNGDSPPASAAPTNTLPKTNPAPVPAPNLTQTPKEKIRHDWYQNDQYVYFTLLAKGVPKDEAVVEIQSTSLSISFPLTTGATYDFSIDPLFDGIEPGDSSYKVLSTKVEVTLKKSGPGIKWKALEGTEQPKEPSSTKDSDLKPSAGIVETGPAAPTYPTSSRKGPKNWDKIVKDMNRSSTGKDKKADEQGQDDDSDSGDEMRFFKKLYAGASDDAKRAMMKSYTESGGTALSTNWADVSKRHVDIDPPDGMEAHKWES